MTGKTATRAAVPAAARRSPPARNANRNVHAIAAAVIGQASYRVRHASASTNEPQASRRESDVASASQVSVSPSASSPRSRGSVIGVDCR